MELIKIKDSIRRYDWLEGNAKKGVTCNLVNTAGANGQQTTTITVAGAGDSGDTVADLQKGIKRVSIFTPSGALIAQGGSAEINYDGGSQAVIAIVEFDQGYIVPCYGAGF